MYLPRLTESYQSREYTDVWLGYNHNLRIEDGELYDDMNMTSAYYPVLSTRQHRTTIAQLEDPRGMIAKDALAWIDGYKLFYDGLEVVGVVLNDKQPKQLVGMGAYICIFPDNIYVNTADLSDFGSIGAKFESNGEVKFEICRRDASSYPAPTVGSEAPEDPANGDTWIDTSGDVHSLKIWSSTTAMWVQQATVYVKITAAGIGQLFEQWDGVEISGAAGNDQVEALNGSHIIYDKTDSYIVIVGLLDETFTQEGVLTVERAVPEMDYVCEASNRLWGCKYGITDNGTVNEIYCCALGDFKNWNRFLGTSTDSWYGSCGSDGMFTGAVTYLGVPTFFKENCIHSVAISSTGAHQITTTNCRGIQRGSYRSPVIVGKTLYYKSPVDICAYEGALPTSVSTQFGTQQFRNAIAGGVGSCYYVCMQNEDDEWQMFVFDAARGLWHREACTHPLCFARVDTDLYYIDEDTKKLMTVNGDDGEVESAFNWYIETGELGYEYPDNKYLSRFNLRMNLALGAEASLFVMYDSDGTWEPKGSMKGTGVRSFTLPVVPRRCDHMKIRLEGKGDCKIYSLAKILETGSDVF